MSMLATALGRIRADPPEHLRIWERVETLADYGQRVWCILDFWHASEHLAETCRLIYGEGSKRGKECCERWKELLRGSRVAAVIEELVAA